MALKIVPQDLAEKQTLVFMPWRYRLKKLYLWSI